MIPGIDLENISGKTASTDSSLIDMLTMLSDADVNHLKDAIWTHKVVVVKGQKIGRAHV